MVWSPNKGAFPVWRIQTLAVLLICLPSLALAGKPRQAGATPKQYTIEQLVKNVRVSGPHFSADESKVLYSSNVTGVFNAWTVPSRGGTAQPVTRSTTESIFAVSYFPNDDRILYTHDVGGNENSHLYVWALDGTEKDLTPGEKTKAVFGGWTHDLKDFYLLTNERDSKFFDLYRVNAQNYQRTLLYKDEVGYDFNSVSDDGKWISFAKLNTTSDSDIYLYDVSAKQMRSVSPHQGNAQYRPEAFDPASRSLYYLTNDGGEFLRVGRYDLASGKHEEVERADWDYTFYAFSWNGKYTVAGLNEDGHTRIKVREAGTDTSVALPDFPEGEIQNVTISRSEKLISYKFGSDREPGNLYVYDLADKKLSQLTDTLNKEVNPKDLVKSQVVRFKSFDGLMIPNLLYQPHQATAQRPAPALLFVHGGPGGQTRAGYSPLIQYLVNHGYVVLGINNRGSSGYGKSFFTADDRKHGREPLWDCVEAKKYLQTLSYVDPNRIGIIGGSYGGYMVLAALAFQPDVFAVGVDLFGVSNWVRTLKSIPPYWESERKALYAEIGDPEKDEQMLRDISPLFHADKIRRPLMVLQGANDPRVIKAESDEIVAEARKHGVPVEYVLFPDEGHGFRKIKNEIEGDRKILGFLDKYLKRSGVRRAASG
jgi:dipeptidyl aminopeptidase/acylaminoacyl peptidase